MSHKMKVEFWTDVICPFCPIGTKHVEKAIEQFTNRHEVEICYRSSRLRPGITVHTVDEYIARKHNGAAKGPILARMAKIAAAEGLEYHMESTLAGDTIDAHRLFHFAGTKGLQKEMVQRLYLAHFTQRKNIFDHTTLVSLAIEVGLEQSDVETMLAGNAFLKEVQADEQKAAEIGIAGVPFVVIDGRFGIGGAEPTREILEALNQAWSGRAVTASSEKSSDINDFCGPDGCEIPNHN